MINALEKSDDWESTAVVILYDDSDGWYDHQMGPIVNQSTSTADQLTGPELAAMAAVRCQESMQAMSMRRDVVVTARVSLCL